MLPVTAPLRARARRCPSSPCLVPREVARVFGPAHGVIGHSLGASATALALGHGLRAECAVLIAPPADPSEWTRHLARRLGMTARVLRLMQTRIERRLGFRLVGAGRAAAGVRGCRFPCS